MGERDAASNEERAALRAALGEEGSLLSGAPPGHGSYSTLHRFQDDLAQGLGLALGNASGLELSVAHRWVASLEFAHARSELSAPAILYECRIDPCGMPLTLALDSRLGAALAERLMGARWSDAGRSARPPGDTEREILLPLTSRIFEAFGGSWGSCRDAGSQVTPVDIISGSDSIHLFRSADRVVVSRFDLVAEGRRGSLYFLLPDALARHLDDPGSVLVSFRWPLHRLASPGSVSMSEDDVLIAAHEVEAPGFVLVSGRTRFMGRLGRLRGRSAVRVLQDVAPDCVEVQRPELEWRARGEVMRSEAAGGEFEVEFATEPCVVSSRHAGHLEPGVVIPLDPLGPDIVRVRRAGRPAARGIPGRVGARFAVRLTRVAASPLPELS